MDCGKRKRQCADAKQRRASSLADNLNGNKGCMVKNDISHGTGEKNGYGDTGKKITVCLRFLAFFGGSHVTCDGILYAGCTHRMHKHHDWCNKPKDAKTFLAENSGKKNPVKKSDEFRDDAGAGKKKSAGDNGAFQITGIQVTA